MKQRILALAVMALPMAAMADVTIYGRINAGLENDHVQLKDGTTTSTNRVEDYLSWIGFKGDEDLGSGLKAIWQVENYILIDGTQNVPGTQTFATRDTFVGLQGNFGKVRLGKLTNPQRDMYNLDIGSNSNGANALDIFERTAGRPNNSIRYDSPSFAGFNGIVQYGFGENKGNNTSGKASDMWAAGLNYNNAGFFAQYGYDHRTNSNGSGKDAYASTLMGGYNANNLLLTLAYQQARGWGWGDRYYYNETTGAADSASTFPFQPNSLKTQEAAITVAYSFGPLIPRVTYSKGWNVKDGNNGDTSIGNSGYWQYILGLDYALSKRTTASLEFGSLNIGNGYTSYTDGSPLNQTGIQKQRTTSVSLQHWF
ncbi:porin [Crenobacter sp. SG2305]|uniref:porin n=1 Tax=Crenobacter oryzisoli TaxID=3056844 RepID=UPI0025AAC870|nr:porin [Crenobacter sp. SG2305]MDN0081505.1 porin [Crenobacter sp. SG2305]